MSESSFNKFYDRNLDDLEYNKEIDTLSKKQKEPFLLKPNFTNDNLSILQKLEKMLSKLDDIEKSIKQLTGPKLINGVWR